MKRRASRPRKFASKRMNRGIRRVTFRTRRPGKPRHAATLYGRILGDWLTAKRRSGEQTLFESLQSAIKRNDRPPTRIQNANGSAARYAGRIRAGLEPRWTHGNKDGVGTAYSGSSRLWFTIFRGVLTEVFYPTALCTQRALTKGISIVSESGMGS